jgi:hypothetical protein
MTFSPEVRIRPQLDWLMVKLISQTAGKWEGEAAAPGSYA